MPRLLSTGLRFAVRVVFRSRLLRWIFLLYLGFWAFDRAIEIGTDAAWFASVGHARLFWHQAGVRALLFWGFALPALALAVVTMRVLAHPDTARTPPPSLPASLAGWDHWRSRVLKLGWLVLLLCIWFLGRYLSAHWVEALQFHYAAPWDVVSSASLWGIHPGFWVFRLPFVVVLLRVCWLYALALLLVTGLGGAVRALPFLAARHMRVPRRWEKWLLTLGALLLLLRGLGYALTATQIPAGDLVRPGDAGAEVLLCLLGLALCIWALLGLRPRVKRSHLAARLGAALLLPMLLNVFLWPLRALGNGQRPAALERWHQECARTAWNLLPPLPLDAPGARTPPLERNWPLWDTRLLLIAARGQVFDARGRVVDWKIAGQNQTPETSTGLVVGVPAGAQGWGAWHEAEQNNANIYRGLDLASVRTGSPAPLAGLAERRATQTLSEHFYGISGPPLFGKGNSVPQHGIAGLPFESLGAKLAWAWRLRSPLLLMEGTHAPRLLVFRDMRVAAQKLAPMFVWDEPHPGPDEWTLEGYGASAHFPGTPPVTSGPLGGRNVARPTLLLHLDPATGALSLHAAAANPFLSTWKRALPELWPTNVSASRRPPTSPSQTAQPPAFFAYETACALVESRLRTPDASLGLGEPFWSVRGSRVVLVRRASIPPQAVEKLNALDTRARREWRESDRLEFGVPALWPDARAPGGYWVARPYFAVSETVGLGERLALRRVLLSGLPSNGLASAPPVVAALSGDEAVREFELQRRSQALSALESALPPSGKAKAAPSSAPTDSLGIQLLRAHEAVEKFAAASNWKAFGQALAHEKQLLQALDRQLRAATPLPSPSRTPSPTATPAASPSVSPTATTTANTSANTTATAIGAPAVVPTRSPRP